MKLYYAAASPFVRKVRIAAIELGLGHRIELVDTHVAPGKDNNDYAGHVNPLGKIPALETDDGLTIVDSKVICEYLNELDGGGSLIPVAGRERWAVQTGHAIADGIMDAAVVNRYEGYLRPEELRWALWTDAQWQKIQNSLDWFNRSNIDSLRRIDEISLACALGYLDFRFEDYSWRNAFSRLAKWHASVSIRTSYIETSPE